jgi:spore germination protein YaaH
MIMLAKASTANCPQEVLGWVPYWDQKRAKQSFKQNSDVITQLSMFWYHLDRRGRVRRYTEAREDFAFVRDAQAKGVKVLAIVANLTDEEGVEEWDRDRVTRTIGEETRRRKHVADLVALARDKEFDGINIDYEALSPEDREPFTAFIHELGTALRAEGKQLAVALHPKSSDPKDDAAGSAAQDWQALARDADQLHLMTYGEHTTDGAAGPIASKGWVSRVLDHATKVLAVDPGRLWFGIPLYAESWQNSCEDGCEDEDLTFTDAAEIEASKGSTTHRDEMAAASYIKDRRGRTIWFEDAWSVGQKIELARQRGICRFAFWRLGGEDPEVWSLLRGSQTP